jgi:hypothetical protein
MENNNADVLTILTEINNTMKLVLAELKKSNEQKLKNPPNLFDIFGGMNQQQGDEDEDEDEEENEEDEDEDEEAEEAEEAEDEDEDEDEDKDEDEDEDEETKDTEPVEILSKKA